MFGTIQGIGLGFHTRFSLQGVSCLPPPTAASRRQLTPCSECSDLLQWTPGLKPGFKPKF